MKKHAPGHLAQWLWIFGAALFLLDQITKYLSRSVFAHRPVDLKIATLTFTNNTGSAFSLLQNQNTLLIWVSLIALGILIYFMEYFKESRISFMLIIVGILGNLTDRLAFGFVTDFIDLGWWPLFNVADSCLVIGVVIYCIRELFVQKGIEQRDTFRKKK